MSENQLFVTIVSPERTLFNNMVESLLVPGEKGQFEVLRNHAAIISTLHAGKVYCNAEQSFEIEIKSGFVEINNNIVTLCVEVS